MVYPPANAEDLKDVGPIPGLRRSPEERNDNPFSYFTGKSSMDIGAWWVTVLGLGKE